MSPADQKMSHPAHPRVFELLPWYHNDALDAAQRAQVDSHLRECLICTREVRRLRQLTIALAGSANEHTSVQAFLRLSAEIEARQFSWRRRLKAVLAGMVAPIPVATCVAVVALCAFLVIQSQRNAETLVGGAEKQFQTLGRQEQLPSSLEQPLLRVVLKDVGLRQSWLARHDAQLIEGPSEIGVMTVKLTLGARSFETIIAQMRAESDTLFVEPLRNIGTRPDRRR